MVGSDEWLIETLTAQRQVAHAVAECRGSNALAGARLAFDEWSGPAARAAAAVLFELEAEVRRLVVAAGEAEVAATRALAALGA